MDTQKPTFVDKELVEVFINKSDLNDKCKNVLKNILLNDNNIRIFRGRNSYVKTCKAIIDMNLTEYTGMSFKSYYENIFRSFLGYYQLLVNDNENLKARERIYFKFCELQQCKSDIKFLQTSEFLFNLYNKISDLNEYHTIIEILDINDQHFDILLEYMYNESICPIKFRENLIIFLANNSSRLNKELYRTRFENTFMKQKRLTKIS